MTNELLKAIEFIEQEKGISREVLKEAIEAALTSAYRKNFNTIKNVRVDFNDTTGEYKVYSRKEVVEEVFDDRTEVELSVALESNPAYEIGDIYEEEVTPKDFGRVGAQAAKQAVMQRIREAEREILYKEFSEHEGDIMNGVIDRIDHRFVYVKLGKTEAILGEPERMPNEQYIPQTNIKVYVTKVENSKKGSQPHVLVSRTHAGLLKRLFESEVPEIYDGIVEIKSVAREAGDRSKISVHSENKSIDAVGACVGGKGARVQTIVDELHGEKIDVVEWSEDPKVFIANALSPSQVLVVQLNEEKQSALVVVPDFQLSLAIGKRGQNARLAAKLTNWKIDIKSESDAIAEGLYAEVKDQNAIDNDVIEEL